MPQDLLMYILSFVFLQPWKPHKLMGMVSTSSWFSWQLLMKSRVWSQRLTTLDVETVASLQFSVPFGLGLVCVPTVLQWLFPLSEEAKEWFLLQGHNKRLPFFFSSHLLWFLCPCWSMNPESVYYLFLRIWKYLKTSFFVCWALQQGLSPWIQLLESLPY
jgi:hypothetical protein